MAAPEHRKVERGELEEELAKVERNAAAYGLRMQAQAHEALADLHGRIARGMEAEAEAIEAGTRRVERRPDGIREAPEDREEREAQAPVLSRVVVQEQVDGPGELLQENGSILGPRMRAWVDAFDPRWRNSPMFARAVNELADGGRQTTEQAAYDLIDRVQALEAAMPRQPDEEEGEPGEH